MEGTLTLVCLNRHLFTSPGEVRQESLSWFLSNNFLKSLKIRAVVLGGIVHFKMFYMYLCVYVCVSMPWHVCGGQRATCGSRFSPFSMWVLRSKLRFFLMPTSDALSSEASCPSKSTRSKGFFILFLTIWRHACMRTWDPVPEEARGFRSCAPRVSDGCEPSTVWVLNGSWTALQSTPSRKQYRSETDD